MALWIPVQCLSIDVGLFPSQNEPIHLNLRCLLVTRLLVCITSKLLVGYLSGQCILSIPRTHVLMNTCSFCSMFCVCFQVSEPYSRTVITLELKSLSLVLEWMFLFLFYYHYIVLGGFFSQAIRLYRYVFFR